MNAEQRIKDITFPGIPTTADGSESVVWVETHITEGACAYPITPSSNMGQGYQAAVANGRKNLWGTPLAFLELESEHSSASSCEGFALAGGRVSNFTSGQGLILMKEVLYTISGKHLPMVFHIGARALTSQSLNIHAGHDDVMGVADAGWGMLFAKNAQESADLALIARSVSEASQTPFMVVQDGFLTTHTVENVRLPEPELMKIFTGDPKTKLFHLMDPEHPLMSGTVQNQDSYMKGKIAQRFFYDTIPTHLENSMNEFKRLTGRAYRFVEPYLLEDAETAIVGLGSAMETVFETVDVARQKLKMKVGALALTSFRPFPAEALVSSLKHLKAFSVIERVDVPLMRANPLTTEIKAAFLNETPSAPKIFSGVYGLGGRDFAPQDILSIFQMMKSKKNNKYFFTTGIQHPSALPPFPKVDRHAGKTFAMRGHSIGGYGSVTTNKILATLLADVFGLFVQAFPKYGSEKKGLPTNTYLTVSDEKIRTHCELEQVDFVALNNIHAFKSGNPLQGLSAGGCLFMPSPHQDPALVWNDIPAVFQNDIQKNNIRIFSLNPLSIAKVQRMQGITLLGVFFKMTPFAKKARIPEKKLFDGVHRVLQKYFGSRGEKIVQDNLECVRKAYHEVSEIRYPGV